jgi:putative peptidoglycan lipid II flippase
MTTTTAVRPSFAKTSVILGASSALATLISLVNQVVIARQFGASSQFDGYLVATSLPLLVGGAIGGIFGYAAVPALTDAHGHDSHHRATNFAFLVILGMIGVLVAVLGGFAAPWLLALQGFHPHDAAQEQTLLLVSRLTWLNTGLGIVIGTMTAVHNTAHKFVAPVLLAFLPYIGSTTVILLSGEAMGVRSIALGLTLGTLLQACGLFAVVFPELAVVRVTRSRFQSASRFLAVAPLALASSLTFSIYQTSDAFWAPGVAAGLLSSLGYCQRILIAVGSIVATGPAVVLQPRLALASRIGHREEFSALLGQALRLTLTLAAPVALGLSLLAGPVTKLALERGSFTPQDTASVAALLPWMLGGMIPMVCTVVMFKALFARNDVRGALVVGLTGPVVYFVMSGVFGRMLGSPGFGFSYASTWTLIALIAWARLGGRTDVPLRLRALFPRPIWLMLVIVAVTTILTRDFLLAQWVSLAPLALLVRLAACGLALVLTAGFSAIVLSPIPELRALAARFLPRLAA